MSRTITSKKYRDLHVAGAVSLGWCSLALLIIYYAPILADTINFKVYDFKISIATPPEGSPQIVHVDVDDEAVGKYGQWPWDRSLSAKIITRLAEFGAKATILDIFYSTPGKSQEGDNAFFEAIRASGNVVSAVVAPLTDNPSEKLELDADTTRGDAVYDRCWNVLAPRKFAGLKVKTLSNAVLPLPDVIQFSRVLGFITGSPDADGVHRRVAPMVMLEDRFLPSLSFAAFAVVRALTPDCMRISGKGKIEIRHGDGITAIPVDSKGTMLVNWGPMWEMFKRYSAADVLSDKPDPSRAARYKDKIVFVGVTATGTSDFGPTPVGAHSPLGRIHSNALNTIMTHNFIVHVPAFPWILIIAVVLTVGFSIGIQRLSWKLAALVAVAICVLVGVIVGTGFGVWSYDIAVGEFFVIFAPAAFVSLVVRAAVIERQGARASRVLERYLAPEVVNKILQSGGGIDLSVKRTEISVLFVDIRGFSTISEAVDVAYIHDFLNDFFQDMTRAVFENRGTVDKFLGDGLLAFFGDPIPLENHAQSALQAALEMQRAMMNLNFKWTRSGISEFKHGMAIRIGINTGMAIVGDLGSARRVEYTVLGSTVNIASRLQSLAPPGGIIMTSRTRAMIQDEIECEGPSAVRVKGIDRDIEVFTILPEYIARLATGGEICT